MRTHLVLVTTTLLAACDPIPGSDATSEPGTSGDTDDTDDTDDTPTGSAGDSESAATTGSIEDTTTDTTSADPTAEGPSGSDTTGEPPPPGCSELAIEDPALLAAIRVALDIPDGPIPGDVAATLGSLVVEQPVTTLAGMECLLGLGRLVLWSSTISDLTPLAPLGKLHSIDVNSSAIVDLGPLVGLPLTSLQLAEAPLADIGPLAQMPQLEYVDFTNTAVEDLSPLSQHPGLLGFGLAGSHPLSLAPITSMPSIYHLRLVDCGLTSVAELAALPNLEILSIGDNQLTDLTGLAGMNALENLWAANNQISDLSALAGLPSLNHLEIANNQVVDLGPLAGAPELTRLMAQDNLISDLQPLADVPMLNALYIDHNPLDGLQGLETKHLGMLSAVDTGLTELLPIYPQGLRYLDLSTNLISDLTPIAGHELLDEVILDHNAIVDLGPIADAPWVASGCAVLDVQANPLSAASISAALPTVCAFNNTAKWDQDSCMYDTSVCDAPI